MLGGESSEYFMRQGIAVCGMAMLAAASVAGSSLVRAAPPQPTREGLKVPPRLPEVVRGQAAPAQGQPLAVSQLPEPLRAAVVADAATAARSGANRIKIKSVESVLWNDGSLGCAAPGMNYTQATVAGYRVVVSAAGREMTYHTDSRRYLVRCEATPMPAKDRAPQKPLPQTMPPARAPVDR
jgi:hypothetical protein